MSIVVINHYSDGLKDYKTAFQNVDEPIFFITNKKQEQSYLDVFQTRIIFDTLYEADNVQKEIAKIHKMDNVARIVATHEFDLEIIGKLRDQLGIQGQKEDNALRYRNKYIMKDILQDVIRVPRFFCAKDKMELAAYVPTLGYPFISKPLSGAGSQGVMLLESEADVIALDDSLFPLLVEQYITGNEMYHVDGIFYNKEFLFVKPSKYINGCLAFKENKPVGSVLLDVDDVLYNQLLAKTKTVINTLGESGEPMPFHVEFFYEHGELIFCEIASRGGGGKINETVREKSGVDMFVESIKLQVSENYVFKHDETLEHPSTFGFILIPVKVGKLIDLPAHVPFDWVTKYFAKSHKIGQTFSGAEYSVSEIVSAIIEGKNAVEVEKRTAIFSEWIDANIVWEKKD